MHTEHSAKPLPIADTDACSPAYNLTDRRTFLKNLALGLAAFNFRDALAGPGEEVPQGASTARVVSGDYRLFVRDRNADGTLGPSYPYTVRGALWTPPGEGEINDPLYMENGMLKWHQADFSLFNRLGINTIQFDWNFGPANSTFRTVLDSLYAHGLKAIIPVDLRYGPFGENKVGEISELVTALKDHPAILLWGVSSFFDYSNYRGNVDELQQIEQYTRLVKSLDSSHAVVLLGTHQHGTSNSYTSFSRILDQIVRSTPSIDIYKIAQDVSTFPALITTWPALAAKPFMATFGESFGTFPSVWPKLFLELSADRSHGACLGGVYRNMWGDRWGSSLSAPEDPPSENLLRLGEELTSPGNSVQLPASVELSVVVSGRKDHALLQLSLNNNEIILSSGGGGGARGFNLAVLDTQAGIRFTAIQNFDTWGDPNTMYQLSAALREISNGSVVVLATTDHAGLYSSNPPPPAQALLDELRSIGATRAAEIREEDAWGMVFVKGGEIFSEQFVKASGEMRLELKADLPINQDLDAGRWLRPQVTKIPSRTNDGVLEAQNLTAGNYHIEVTEDLKSWRPLGQSQPVDRTGSLLATDGEVRDGVQVPQRFYNIRRTGP